MGRRRESVDPSDDHTSPAPEAIIHLVKRKCMKERCANNHQLQVQEGQIDVQRSLWLFKHWQRLQEQSVDVNDDDCNDEDDDVDDDESECEYISDSDGEFN